MKRHASFNKSGKETERILRREFERDFGSRDFASITEADVIGLIGTITDRGAPVLARNNPPSPNRRPCRPSRAPSSPRKARC